MSASTEWQKLCDMYETARNDVHKAWQPVQQKYGAIAAKKSHENPTDEELKRLEVAREHQQLAQQAMDIFIKLHFPSA